MISRAMTDVRLQTAAAIGDRFSIDPLIVLNADTIEWNIRIAAYNYVVQQENAAHAAAESKSKSKSGRRS